MTKPLAKTTLKFLSLADSTYQGKSLGTHAYNLKSYYSALSDRGLVEGYPIVHLTDAGRSELRAYYLAGGKKAR
jgi:hypothetical protein